MTNPYQVVKDFESALCEYTGAPYAVTVTSCTMALLLAVKYCVEYYTHYRGSPVCLPSKTYVSVPMSVVHAGGTPIFMDYEWRGNYQLDPYPVHDSARWFTKGLFDLITNKDDYKYVCCSFHWTKTLSVGQGGCILHDDHEADEWFRRMRFDGRTEGLAPKNDRFSEIGYHCYMSPRDAAEGLSRLAVLPEHNDPLPNDDYPSLGQLEVFK